MSRVMRRPRLVALSVMVMAVAVACGGGAPSAPGLEQPGSELVPGAPLASAPAGDLIVTLYSAPAQPNRGQVSLEAAITDADGRPVSDATVTFDLNMTNMNHGRNVVAASPTGNGRYAGEVFFMMPGPWRVIVGIDRGGQQRDVRFDFMVR